MMRFHFRKSGISLRFANMFAAGMLIGSIFHVSPANAQQSCYYPPSGLISWWRGEGNADDITSFNNGTWNGTARFSAGKVGDAFYFDGNSFVQARTSGFPIGSAPRTVEMWVYSKSAILILTILVTRFYHFGQKIGLF